MTIRGKLVSRFIPLVLLLAVGCEATAPHNAPPPPAPKYGAEALAAFLGEDAPADVDFLRSMTDMELAQVLLDRDRERLEALRGPNPPAFVYGRTLEEEIAHQETLVEEGNQSMAWAEWARQLTYEEKEMSDSSEAKSKAGA